MKLKIFIFSCSLFCLGSILLLSPSQAMPDNHIKSTTRCQICGMFVKKYPNWLTLLKTKDGSTHYFDGVKDLMVFTLNSRHYGLESSDIQEIWVKDYYTLDWLDARSCFYVIGSDVFGPMGHEFIPFSSKEAAVNFKKDHFGTEIILFSDISQQRVDSMRVGQKMR